MTYSNEHYLKCGKHQDTHEIDWAGPNILHFTLWHMHIHTRHDDWLISIGNTDRWGHRGQTITNNLDGLYEKWDFPSVIIIHYSRRAKSTKATQMWHNKTSSEGIRETQQGVRRRSDVTLTNTKICVKLKQIGNISKWTGLEMVWHFSKPIKYKKIYTFDILLWRI